MRYCITGLPRSRTAWFSAYMTACGSLCAHEGMAGCDSIEDYFEKMQDFEGNSDSGICMYPHDIPTVIIEREVDEVKNSIDNMALGEGSYIADVFYEKLQSMKGLRIKFNEINERLEEINDYCGVPYHPIIAENFKNMNITIIDMSVNPKTVDMMEDLLCQHG